MIPTRRAVLGSAFAAAALPARAAAGAPAPFGATPSARQLAWQAGRANAFLHFTVNTFTDREWGTGEEDPRVFDPTDFSAEQIVQTVKAGGFKGVILTAKHHDGFCLWPSAFTEHSVKNSPFRGGHGDVVREISDAARRVGLKFGVYLSPWDRNRADYATPKYVEVYRAQLRELLTHYGEIFEVWFDGANGGDGYYGGARETRHIDADHYYGWEKTVAMVHRLQPGAVTFGPTTACDLRWVGNEDGTAGEPCWTTLDRGRYTQEKGQHGVRGGPLWRPAEADVSIRKGWFWHAAEDATVKSPTTLADLYLKSAGRATNLLLNLPPDRRGRIADPDVRAVEGFGRWQARFWAEDLAKGARAQASVERGRGFEAHRVLDGDPGTYWTCPDGVRAASLTLALPRPERFDVIRVSEHLPLGQRVYRFALDVGTAGGWRQVADLQSIGAQRLFKLDTPVTSDRMRLRVLDAPAGPAIGAISLHRSTPV